MWQSSMLHACPNNCKRRVFIGESTGQQRVYDQFCTSTVACGLETSNLKQGPQKGSTTAVGAPARLLKKVDESLHGSASLMRERKSTGKGSVTSHRRHLEGGDIR